MRSLRGEILIEQQGIHEGIWDSVEMWVETAVAQRFRSAAEPVPAGAERPGHARRPNSSLVLVSRVTASCVRRFYREEWKERNRRAREIFPGHRRRRLDPAGRDHRRQRALAAHPAAVAVSYVSVGVFVAGIGYRFALWAKSSVPFCIPVTCGQQASLPGLRHDRLDNPNTPSGAALRVAMEACSSAHCCANIARRPGTECSFTPATAVSGWFPSPSITRCW